MFLPEAVAAKTMWLYLPASGQDLGCDVFGQAVRQASVFDVDDLGHTGNLCALGGCALALGGLLPAGAHRRHTAAQR